MFNKAFLIIAVDGGAASGKSSSCKILSERLNLLHVDTGAHYRAITYLLLSNEIYPDNPTIIVDNLSNYKLDTDLIGRSAHMTINNEIPKDFLLRSPLVNQYVSQFASIPQIRKFLIEYQRSQKDFAKKHSFKGVIMEGRDIGSVVLPDADFKFFLEADQQTRSHRRVLQGQVDAIHVRDELDLARKIAPMLCPAEAIRIDTSHLSLEEVAKNMIKIITD